MSNALPLSNLCIMRKQPSAQVHMKLSAQVHMKLFAFHCPRMHKIWIIRGCTCKMPQDSICTVCINWLCIVNSVVLRSTQTHKYVLEVFINQLWICMNHFLFDISFFLRDCSYNLSFIMYLYGWRRKTFWLLFFEIPLTYYVSLNIFPILIHLFWHC